MKQALYSSRTADKFVVRLPDGMRERIAGHAKTNHRSMNSEIISRLEESMTVSEGGIIEKKASDWVTNDGSVPVTMGMLLIHKATGHIGRLVDVRAVQVEGGPAGERQLHFYISTYTHETLGRNSYSGPLSDFKPVLI